MPFTKGNNTMKKLLLILLCLPIIGFGQITTTKVAEKKEEISIEPYDSLQNFLGKDLHRYIGQDFYLKGKAESLREYGYDGFLIDYKYKGYIEKTRISVAIAIVLSIMN